MPPKVKAKAKAKAKGLPKAKAKGLPKAKARAQVRIRGALRRPGLRGGEASEAAPGVLDRWKAGEPVRGLAGGWGEVGLGEGFLLPARMPDSRSPDGSRRAGRRSHPTYEVDGHNPRACAEASVREARPRVQGPPCSPSCGQEEAADDLCHVVKLRRIIDADKEPGWIRNLEKVAAAEDELGALRKRQQEVVPLIAGDVETGGHGDEKDGKKEKRKKKKAKKEKRRQVRQGVQSSGSPRQWDAAKGSKPKRSQTSVPRDWAGPKGERKSPSCKRSQALREEEGSQVFVVDGVRGRQQNFRDGGDGRPGGGVRLQSDEVSFTDGDRTRESPRGPEGSCPGLLPTSAATSSQWPGPEGAVDSGHSHRWVDGRQGSKHRGFTDPTDEVLGAHHEWKPLVGFPTPGSLAQRESPDYSGSRAARGQERQLCGLPHSERCRPARRETIQCEQEEPGGQGRRQRRSTSSRRKERRKGSGQQGRSRKEGQRRGSERRQVKEIEAKRGGTGEGSPERSSGGSPCRGGSREFTLEGSPGVKPLGTMRQGAISEEEELYRGSGTGPLLQRSFWPRCRASALWRCGAINA